MKNYDYETELYASYLINIIDDEQNILGQLIYGKIILIMNGIINLIVKLRKFLI